MVTKYRKKPIEIEAVQYTQDNVEEIKDFVGKALTFCRYANDTKIFIDTLEGKMMLTKGDYIIKGVNGEFYPCKPDIFEKTYEKVLEKTTPNNLQ